MTGEWVERRVADLEVGDDVKGVGVIRETRLAGTNSQYMAVSIAGRAADYWPRHARVDIRRPVEVTLRERVDGLPVSIHIGTRYVGELCKAHAEEYAARLRSSDYDRALALGKDTA